jgi:hypothetical protein
VTEAAGGVRLRWLKLSHDVRDLLLARKLKGLYGAERDEDAFDNLDIDKQQALLLLAHRLNDLGLWDSVRRVENVYGMGGVGMNFRAWPGLLSGLQTRKDFTTLFAAHRDTAEGFIERARARVSLHFLCQDKEERRWAVHFDLYNPWSSPANALRHLLYEKIRGTTPDWRAVRAAFRQEGKLF